MGESSALGFVVAGVVLLLGVVAGLAFWSRARRRQTNLRKEAERTRRDREDSLQATISALRRNIRELTQALEEKTVLYERWDRLLQEFQDRMAARASVQDVAEITVRAAARLLSASHAAFYLLRENHLEPIAKHGYSRPLPKLRVGEGRVGWIAKHRVPLHRDDPYFANIPAAPGEPEVHLGVPILAMGHLLGLLVVGGAFPQASEHKKRLLMLAHYCGPNLLLTLQGGFKPAPAVAPSPKPGFRLFSMDDFTRRAEEECEKARRFHRTASLTLFALDSLSDLLHSNGREKARQAVAAFCEVLQSQLRSYDIAAQRAADEFLILCPEADKQTTLHVAERIRQRYQENVQRILKQPVGLSGGVAAFPEDGDTAERLIHVASHGMRQAREAGGNRIVATR